MFSVLNTRSLFTVVLVMFLSLSLKESVQATIETNDGENLVNVTSDNSSDTNTSMSTTDISTSNGVTASSQPSFSTTQDVISFESAISTTGSRNSGSSASLPSEGNFKAFTEETRAQSGSTTSSLSTSFTDALSSTQEMLTSTPENLTTTDNITESENSTAPSVEPISTFSSSAPITPTSATNNNPSVTTDNSTITTTSSANETVTSADTSSVSTTEKKTDNAVADNSTGTDNVRESSTNTTTTSTNVSTELENSTTPSAELNTTTPVTDTSAVPDNETQSSTNTTATSTTVSIATTKPDKNECITGDHDCKGNGSVCVNDQGSYHCNCNKGWYSKTDDGKNCKQGKVQRILAKYDIKWIKEYEDRNSKQYTDRVNDILAEFNKSDDVLERQVLRLRKGSVIADIIVVTKSENFTLPSNSTGVFIKTREYECHPTIPDMCLRGYNCEFKNDEYHCAEDKCRYFGCINGGTCLILDSGDPYCRCTDKYTGDKCYTPANADYLFLEKIAIAVGVGLGTLLLFSTIALIIVCCAGRNGKADSLSAPKRSNGRYAIDEVTIDTYMPSLPRPKLKPGVFADDEIEMRESGTTSRNQRQSENRGTDNPAFIPEADYDDRGKAGRHAINGKKNDYVYF